MLNRRVICLLVLCSLPLFLHAQDANEELLAAARKSDVAKVKDLLAKGADLRIKSKTGKTAAEMAKDPTVIDLLKASAK